MMESVKGFKDYIGIDALKRKIVKDILIKNFELYGFEPAETPVIESAEFVQGENQNDETISDVFRLRDKGDRNLALRYEFTFQLKRIAKNQKMPFKRYQIGEVFRDEPVSSARFRQITQCDVDTIGSTIKDDAEILAMTYKILNELKVPAFILVNNRKLLNEIMEKEGISSKEQVIKEIDKLDKLPENEVRNNLKKYKAENLIEIFKNKDDFFKKYDSYKEIEELKKYCEIYGVKINFSPSLARGLSYYNGTIFEVKTAVMKESVCGGGSYQINDVQSTGISFGLERLSQLASIDVSEKRILIISIGEDEQSIKTAERLRKEGIDCVVMYGKISKSLEFANSYKIPYAIFLGEEEAKKKKLKLRDMKTGIEKMLSLDETIGMLKAKEK